jgi:hypothetical protein
VVFAQQCRAKCRRQAVWRRFRVAPEAAIGIFTQGVENGVYGSWAGFPISLVVR